MSDIEFIPGQRWVSNTEAELGLGIIRECSGRRLEVFFPAVEESRFYASDNAPLSRVIYSVGEQIQTQEQQRFTISAVQPFNGCFIYQGETADGDAVSFHEMDLDSRVHFNQPQDRLFAGQVDKNSQFELRAKTLANQHALYSSEAFGLLGARVQLLPHQLYIAREVSQRIAPRVLLADEVGLGKTIEAGLILHQKVLSGEVKRALVIVPDALQHQWLVEMLRRFNLSFTLIDAERHSALVELDEGNPYDSAQLVLAGLSELIQTPAMQADVLNTDWDMLIVDEAHHLFWTPEQRSDEYALIEQLAAKTPGLLLLTATPEQLGVDSHFARLRLLDPDKFHDLQAFRDQEAAYQPVSDLIEALDTVDDPSTLESSLIGKLAKLISESTLASLKTDAEFQRAKTDAIRQLLDYHGTGRVLFRNTRDAVAGFPQRNLHGYPLAASTKLTGLAGVWPEDCHGDDWLEQDVRVTWLLEFLKQHRGEKVLLICAQANTAVTLDNFLSVQHGVRCAAFHEHMSLVNRDRAAAFFADDEEGAQLLVCSEIGSEGRNFQFCQNLVLFDLPLNPDLLEQRIGRLDRIGQQGHVQIHVPFFENSTQSVLYQWYSQGMNAFEQVFPAGDAIRQQTETALTKSIETPSDKALLKHLVSSTQELSDKARTSLQSGRNRLLERNSFDDEKAQHLIAELEELTRGLELADFMDDVFDAFGVEQQPHSSDSVIIEPGSHMAFAQFPGLPEDGLTATYQRHRALGREDMAFLTWEHPMVLGAMDMVVHSEIGNSAFCTLESSAFRPGTLLLEALFKVQTIGPMQPYLSRFLPQRYLRVVVDEQGRQHQEALPDNQFNKSAGRIPKATAQELIRHARPQIEVLLNQARNVVKASAEEIKTQSLAALQHEMEREHARLHALAQVNPAIRQAEIDNLEEASRRLADTLQSAELGLDAIRVAIVTEPS